MSSSLLAGIIVFGVIVLLVVAIVYAVRERRGSGVGSLTALQDFLPKDKQEAIESIIQQKDSKKKEEQKTGEPNGKTS